MRFLSIQSHVAYGHVGNAAIQLPLQRLGIEVMPVHTVLLSNHRGYASAHGPTIPATDLQHIIRGLGQRGVLADCDVILSGYLADPDIGAVVLDTVNQIKRANPDAFYCCDPVIGDTEDGTYVDPEIVPLLRDELIPAADVITPNQFELGLLTGRPLQTRSDIQLAASSLRDRGPDRVLVTSVRHDAVPADRLEMHAYGANEGWAVATPRLSLADTVKGAGDIVAALFAAHLQRTNTRVALERAAASVFAVLELTSRERAAEMLLVAAQDQIVCPARLFSAELIKKI